MRISVVSFHRRASVVACAFALLMTTGLIAFALLGHPMLVYGAEYDHFLDQAEALLAGKLPWDPHRPLLYPLLAAGGGWLAGGDCFLAGRMVTALAGGGSVLATYFLGRAVADRATGLLAAVLVGLHPAIWENCVQVTTDSTFMALMVLSTLAAVQAARHGTLRAACACGLCVAMAYFTRYTAIALMPAVTAGILLGSAPGRRLAALGVFGAGLVAGLIPHCALTWKIFGRLFYDEAWRSLAFRHFGDGNWAFIENNPFRGTWSVLCHDPGRLLTNALAGVGNYLSVDLPHQLAGRDGPVAWWLVLCLAAGAALSWQRRVAPALVTLLASLGYASLVAVTFFTWERIMLPLLPLLMVPIAWSLVHLPATPLRRRRFGRARVLMSLAVALLAVAGVASQLPARLLSFVASHPRREVEVARDLVRRDGPGIVLLSSYDAMRRYVPCLCIPPQHGTHATVVYEGIARILLTRSADYAVFGPNSQGPALYQDLRQTPVPGHLQLLLDEPDVRLYRVAMPPMERLAAGALTVRPQGGQVFELSLELRADAPPEVLAGVGVLGPDGKATTVVLQPAAGRMRSGSLTLPGGMHGRWRLFPRILDRSGTLHAGPELSVEVP